MLCKAAIYHIYMYVHVYGVENRDIWVELQPGAPAVSVGGALAGRSSSDYGWSSSPALQGPGDVYCSLTALEHNALMYDRTITPPYMSALQIRS